MTIDMSERHGEPTAGHDHESAARAAGVAAALLLGVTAFQGALAAGAPWGAHAYGGRAQTRRGVLSPGYRVMSLAAATSLSLAAWVLLAGGGLVARGRVPRAVVDRAAWVCVGFFALNTVGNLASTSPVERWLLGSVTASVTALGWRVARAAPPPAPTPAPILDA